MSNTALFDGYRRAWEEAKALHDSVEGRDFSAEEQEKWDRLNADMTRFDELIQREKGVAEAQAAAAEFDGKYGEAAPVGEKNSDEDVLRAMLRGETRAHEFRDVTVAGDSGLIPTGFYPRLTEYLQENAAIVGAGATVLRTAGGEAMTVPRITAHPSAAIVTEGGTIGESDPTTGSVTLDAYKYAFITQVSSEFLADQGVDIVGYLARQGGVALGNGAGAHFVTGTGTGQPNGIVTAASTGKTGATGNVGVPQADELIDLQHSVIAPYRSKAGTAFVMSDTTLAAVRKLKDSNGAFIWQPSAQLGAPSILLGDRVVIDPNVADAALSAKSVIYGDLASYFVRFAGALRVERSDDFAFNADLASWRFIMRADGDLVDANGLKLFVGAAS